MDGGIDWFTLAITVPIVPAVAIISALLWLRTVRPKPDEAEVALDNTSGWHVAGESDRSSASTERSGQP